MKLFLQFTLFFGLMAPSIASGMEDIINLRGQFIDSDEESIHVSLSDSIFSPRKEAEEAAALERVEQQNKENASLQASAANRALEAKLQAISEQPLRASGKEANDAAWQKKSGIKHKVADDIFEDNNDEWGDSLSGTPPVPPFEEPAEDANLKLDEVAPANSNADYIPPVVIIEEDEVPAVPERDLYLLVDVATSSDTPPPLPSLPSDADDAPAVPERDADEQPTIEEMADPDRPPVPAHSDDEESQDEFDLRRKQRPPSSGVRVEISPNAAPQKHAHPRTPRTPFKTRVTARPPVTRRPLPAAPKPGNLRNPQTRTQTQTNPEPAPTTKRPVVNCPELRRPEETEFQLPVMNLMISAVALGVLSFISDDLLPKNETRTTMIACEFVHGAQQAAAANIAQQMLPGKAANSAAFTAVFSILHACEIGFRKGIDSFMNNTKAGKRVAMKFKKMSDQKRAIISNAGMATSWVVKTLLARAITA